MPCPGKTRAAWRREHGAGEQKGQAEQPGRAEVLNPDPQAPALRLSAFSHLACLPRAITPCTAPCTLCAVQLALTPLSPQTCVLAQAHAQRCVQQAVQPVTMLDMLQRRALLAGQPRPGADAVRCAQQAVQLVNTLNLMRRRAPSDWAAVAPSTLGFPDSHARRDALYRPSEPAAPAGGTSQVRCTRLLRPTG